jgi:hypothetical protein
VNKICLAIIALVYLYATPSNIACDTLISGGASISTTIIYILGLMALVWVSYALGRDSKRG